MKFASYSSLHFRISKECNHPPRPFVPRLCWNCQWPFTTDVAARTMMNSLEVRMKINKHMMSKWPTWLIRSANLPFDPNFRKHPSAFSQLQSQGKSYGRAVCNPRCQYFCDRPHGRETSDLPSASRASQKRRLGAQLEKVETRKN